MAEGKRPFDFADVKGVMESLLKQLGVAADFVPGSDASFHPVRQADIAVRGSRIGVLGEVHPKVLGAFDIVEPAFLFELNVRKLMEFIPAGKTYQPIPRFPAMVRDIALIVDEVTTHKQVAEVIKGNSLVAQVALFDVYSGKQVPAGKKSLAYRIIYQSPERTLTEDEVNDLQQKILTRLNKQFGATLRA